MIKFKIIDDYLSKNQCNLLVEDAKKILEKNKDFQILNNNRQLVSSTGIRFNEFVTKSENWRNLNRKLISKNFYDFCFKSLEVDNNDFQLSNFFFNEKLNFLEKKYKELSYKRFIYLNLKQSIFVTIYRFYKIIKFKLFYFFRSKKNIELIYDFSIAQNGYKREIHRDSDSRILVFLIYLNQLSSDTAGGNLNIYKLKENKNIKPAKPEEVECDLIDSVEPKPGRLVVFLNSAEAYHSVTTMTGKDKRFFIYGSYTLLNKSNPFIKDSGESLKTDYFLFH
jgi:hypothetical protein